MGRPKLYRSENEENEEPTQNVFEVEMILAKVTTTSQKVLYLIKWKNYSCRSNSWEPVENVMCSRLLKNFKEEEQPARQFNPNGFERGFTPEAVVGITRIDGNLYIIMKWAGLTVKEIILSSLARIYCPQLLLNFYEKYGKITIGGKIVPEIPEQRDMNTTEEMEP